MFWEIVSTPISAVNSFFEILIYRRSLITSQKFLFQRCMFVNKVTWHIDHVVTWQIKNVVSLLSQGLWIPNLTGWWLMMGGPHSQNHVAIPYRGHVIIKKAIFPLSQGLWTANLAVWWLRMRELHPQSHVTNYERFCSTFTRPMAPKTW